MRTKLREKFRRQIKQDIRDSGMTVEDFARLKLRLRSAVTLQLALVGRGIYEPTRKLFIENYPNLTFDAMFYQENGND